MLNLSHDPLKALGTMERTESRLKYKEKKRTVLAFILLLIGASLNCAAKVLATLRLPDRKTYKPLPDLFLDSFNNLEWAIDFTDLTIALLLVCNAGLVILHVHKQIIMRRLFTILAILMAMRVLFYSVTILPIAAYEDSCFTIPEGSTSSEITIRFLKNVARLGMMLPQDYCGDYIYSGHTTTIITLCLTFQRYSPESWYIRHLILKAVSSAGIILLLVARGHYTIDVVVAYYFSTRIFWTWHTLAEVPGLKGPSKRVMLRNSWWHFLFNYMEAGVDGVVPNVYEVPWKAKGLRISADIDVEDRLTD